MSPTLIDGHGDTLDFDALDDGAQTVLDRMFDGDQRLIEHGKGHPYDRVLAYDGFLAPARVRPLDDGAQDILDRRLAAGDAA